MGMHVSAPQYTCNQCGGKHFQIALPRMEDTVLIAAKCDNCGLAGILSTTPEQTEIASRQGLPNGDEIPRPS